MPTVSEIAKQAGVSKSTVSLALNNKPGVSDRMRQRVLDALNDLRVGEEFYVLSHAIANSHLTPNGPNDDIDTLSVVVLHPPILRSSEVFSELLQGIQAGAAARQIQLNLAVNEPDLSPDHVTQLYFSDPALRPDGVLVIGARQEEPLVDLACELGLPVVLVGREAPSQAVSSVGRDEMGSAVEATRCLIDLGHRAIGFAGGDLAYSYVESRLAGYRDALAGAGIEPLARWATLGDGQTAAARLLAASPEISAVLFINDAYAAEGLPVFQAAGRTIPADLSIISFDDTEVARSFDPPLTSVLYPRFQEGLWSIKTLVDHIRQPLLKHCQIVFRSTLVRRESCAPPRSAGIPA